MIETIWRIALFVGGLLALTYMCMWLDNADKGGPGETCFKDGTCRGALRCVENFETAPSSKYVCVLPPSAGVKP